VELGTKELSCGPDSSQKGADRSGAESGSAAKVELVDWPKNWESNQEL